MSVPILVPKPLTTAVEYAVELCMISGRAHRLTFRFEIPAGPDGAVDFAKLKDLDPEAQSIAQITSQISKAFSDPVIFADRQQSIAQQRADRAKVDIRQVPQDRQPIAVTVANDSLVVWRHVESFKFLGPLADLEAKERTDAAEFADRLKAIRGMAADRLLIDPLGLGDRG